MRQIFQLCILAIAAGFCVFGQPTIGAVVNSASYASAPVGNNTIAQGSIFVVFGTGMGPGTLTFATTLPLPTSLPDANGTSISISSGGQVLKAFMVYTLAGQVAAILPSNTPIGQADVTLTYNGKTSAAIQIAVVKSRLGIFTANQQGNGPAAAQIATDMPPSVVNLTNPAKPGKILTLYGTGLGAINGPDNVAPGAVQVGSNVTVNIAGKVVPADYAGRSPQFAGLDQINFTVPADVATGCYVPAEVTASGQPSNAFYLSIASAGSSSCTHPLGLSADALSRLDAGGTVNTGLFLLLRAVVVGQPAEGAGGLFETADANATFQLFNRILVAFGGYNYPVAAGSCAVVDSIDPPSGFAVPDFTTLGGKELQAGQGLNLSGTNGNSAIVPRQIPDTGGYLTVFFGTLGKGTWTLAGSGGADVGVFASKTDLPENLIWSNNGAFASPPRGDLTITWTGGATNAQSLVTVFGTSVVVNPTDPSKNRGAQFYCNALASTGRLVVPAAIVLQLPSSNNLAAGEVAFGSLGINSGGGSTFTAPLTSGAKFDGAFLSYGEAHTLSVKFQ